MCARMPNSRRSKRSREREPTHHKPSKRSPAEEGSAPRRARGRAASGGLGLRSFSPEAIGSRLKCTPFHNREMPREMKLLLREDKRGRRSEQPQLAISCMLRSAQPQPAISCTLRSAQPQPQSRAGSEARSLSPQSRAFSEARVGHVPVREASVLGVLAGSARRVTGGQVRPEPVFQLAAGRFHLVPPRGQQTWGAGWGRVGTKEFVLGG